MQYRTVLLLALVLCAAVVVTAKHRTVKHVKKEAEKVKVEVYFESFCPGCMSMISEKLFPAFADKGLASIIDLTLVPYGNAKETKNGDEWVFSCQHGDKECKGNLYETCAIMLYPSVPTHFKFIACLDQSDDPLSVAKQCAGEEGLNYTAIVECAEGPMGNKWEHMMAVATESLSPNHTWVPWVVMNGKHYDEDVDADPVKNICALYTGSDIPEACKFTRRSRQAASKVKVGVYMESYCPDCMDMMDGILYPAFAEKGLGAIMDLSFYPYGNAEPSTSGGIACQHGEKECEGNLIETCAIYYHPKTEDHFKFIHCLESSGDPIKNGESCAKAQKWNYTQIANCVTGDEGAKLELVMQNATDSLVPEHEWVPWVTINDKHVSEDVDGNPIAAICSAYTGTTKPEACKALGFCFKQD